MAKMTFIIIIVICVFYCIKKIFMEDGDASKTDDFIKENEKLRKEFDNFVKEFSNLSKEEQRNRLINHINECSTRKRNFLMMDFNAIKDVNYLIITNLKMGKDVDVAKQVLLEIYDISCKQNGTYSVIKSLEGNIEYYQEKGETEIANIYQEIKCKYEEEWNCILDKVYYEAEYNIENNHFIETNMPLIAEEGCFEIFDNIEYYEYRTRYGSTNYEKINEGKIYITNQRLYFITDINAFHLVWINNIMDVDWYFVRDENKFQLKITRDGNAIFLESYDEVDIYKMCYYIKIIMKNK